MVGSGESIQGAIRPYQQTERLLSSNPVVHKGYQPKPVLILRWLGDDRTLVSVSPPGAAVSTGIDQSFARSYRELLQEHPAFCAALEHAFDGQSASINALLNNVPVDIQITPDLDATGRVSTVMAIFSDASERIASLRAVRVIEILSELRRLQNQSATLDGYLKKCCEVLESVYEGLWIGEIEEKSQFLRVISGTGRFAAHFASHQVSIGPNDQNGFHCVSDAIRNSRTACATHIHQGLRAQAYRGWADSWSCILSVPMVIDGHTVGTLNVLDNDASLCSPPVLAIWEQIADEICSGWQFFRLRQQEEAMRNEGKGLEEQYLLLLSTMLDVIVIHRAGKILDVNEAGVKLLKAGSKEDLIGTHLKTLLVPENRAQQYADLTCEQNQQLREFKLQSFTGEVIEVEGVTYQGRFSGSPAQHTSFRDITERNQSNTKLRTAKQSLEYAQQVAQIGHVRVDLATDQTEWSVNARAILGIPEDEPERSFLDTCQQQMNVVDFDTLNHAYWSIISTGKRQRSELYVASVTDLTKRVVTFTGIPETNDHGRVTHVVFVMQDVTRYQLRINSTQRAINEADALLSYAMAGCIGLHCTSERSLETTLVTLDAVASRAFGREPGRTISQPTLDKLLEDADQQVRERIQHWLNHEVGQNDERYELGVVCFAVTGGDIKSLSIAGERAGDRIRLLVKDVSVEQALSRAHDDLTQRFALTKKVARMVEWYFDIKKQEVHWRSDVEEFLGHRLPVPYLTYDQFMGTVRAEDRPGIRAAVNHTISTREPADMVYVQKFHSLPDIRLYGRWVPHIVNDELVGLLGISIDVGRMKMPTFNDAERSQFDINSGLPRRQFLVDRMKYFESAGSWSNGLYLLAFKIHEYRAIKRVIPIPADFYRIQREWEPKLRALLPQFDTLAKLEAGVFVVLVKEPINRRQEEKAREVILDSLRALFSEHHVSFNAMLGGDEITVSVALEHIPDPTAVDVTLGQMEMRLRQSHQETSSES